MTEQSATRRPVTPRTRRNSSTTRSGSASDALPILHVPTG
eukprot:CAMPEP_0205820558 /NCGR_PEP_ID=MMETSP0206-20130828/3209_1 /ASSEMBLY_ACC=CAM_ASM_000279 /TAXON_ID=36767 /ORGANISM="Euplotes focardii, Strain TN1" /LENGTH=39 /DNA_ID= /DNA_START= /DNA_END= /DNA_ORIENTATION=